MPISNPGGGAGGTPASTVTDETTWGVTPAVGVGTAYARDDHTHGSPAEPVESDPVFLASEAAGLAAGDAAKLAGIEAGAEVNNISDVNATDLTDGGATTLHSHAVSGQANIQWQDEGNAKGDSGEITTVNFVGAGVTAADSTSTLTVTIPGGAGEAFPVGSVFIAVVDTDPATLLGYGTWSAFGAGKVLIGIDAGDADFDTVEETGGAKAVASAGTLDSISGGTPAGTNDSISGGTPAGTNASVSGGTPAGTNDSISGGTPAGTVAWPAGVPTFSGSALAGHTHTFAGSALAGHTHTFAGSALAGHTHTTDVAGVGATQRGATASTLTLKTHTHPVLSNSAGTPAGTNSSVSGGTPAGTLDSISGGTPAGTIAWPVGVPTFSGSALAGHTHTFAGGALAGHTHTFAGAALAGHTHTFAGAALAGHTHTYAGSATSVVQPYIVVYMWKRVE